MTNPGPRLAPLPPEHTPELGDQFVSFMKTLGFVPNSVLTMQRKPALVLANWHPEIGVICLIVFTVLASALLLRFWEVEGPMRTGMQNGLLANIGIVGGLLLLLQNVR